MDSPHSGRMPKNCASSILVMEIGSGLLRIHEWNCGQDPMGLKLSGKSSYDFSWKWIRHPFCFEGQRGPAKANEKMQPNFEDVKSCLRRCDRSRVFLKYLRSAASEPRSK